jgi:DNA-binding transcriptional MerR regulator
MTESFSIQTLSEQVNEWCEEHGVSPVSGQAGDNVSERSIRYYRTLGLLDAPEGGSYGEKHLLQIIAIRLLQAQGLPLRRIRELLYGRSLEELREVRRQGLNEAQRMRASVRVSMPVEDEIWRTIPISEDYLLVSRRGTPLTPAQREAVLLALTAGSPGQKPHNTKH